MAQSREEQLAKQREYNSSPAGKAASQRYRAKPEKRAIKAAASKRWAKANPERCRVAWRSNRGIVDAPGEVRGGECAICGKTRKKLHCDHDYETGRMRGWLCSTCNSFIGQTDAEAIARAERVLQYVKTVI